MKLERLALFVAALALAGCSICSGPSAPPTPAVQTEARPLMLNGVARYFGQPFQGAAVTAFPLGSPEAVAHASTGADGRFAIELPTALRPGALVKMLAEREGRLVATVVRVPARVLQQVGGNEPVPFVIDEQRTLALLLFAPRLSALVSLATGPDGAPLVDMTAQAQQGFEAVTAALVAGGTIQQPTFETTMRQALDARGNVTPSNDTARGVAEMVPQGVAQQLEEHARKLADLIRTLVALGKPKPADNLIGLLPLGRAVNAPPVFPSSPTPPPTIGGGSSLVFPPAQISFDAGAYAGVATAVKVTISDRAAVRNASVLEQVTVQVNSETETTPDTLVLTEEQAGSGIFVGQLWLERRYDALGNPAPLAQNGKLTVYADVDVPKDTLTVTYKGKSASVDYTEPLSTLSGYVRVAQVLRPHASVTLTAPDASTRQTAARDDASYAFYDLPPGTYLLTFAAKDAQTETHSFTIPQP